MASMSGTGRPSAWRRALPLAGFVGVVVLGGVIILAVYTPRSPLRLNEMGVGYDARSGRYVEAGLMETVASPRYWLARYVYALFLLVTGCILLLIHGIAIAIRGRFRLSQEHEVTGRQALYGGILVAFLGPMLLCGASALSIEFFQLLRGVYPHLP